MAPEENERRRTPTATRPTNTLVILVAAMVGLGGGTGSTWIAQQSDPLRYDPASRPDPFTGTEGKALRSYVDSGFALETQKQDLQDGRIARLEGFMEQCRERADGCCTRVTELERSVNWHLSHGNLWDNGLRGSQSQQTNSGETKYK